MLLFAKKIGYKGWSEFKKDFVEENRYLSSHFQNIDANMPFNKNDNMMNISYKIANLQKETIDDTLSLIQHDSLQKALQIIKHSTSIAAFGSGMTYMACQEFVYAMKKIEKCIEYIPYNTEQVFWSRHMMKNSCAIVISYTGETNHNIKICQYLKKNHIPIISLTSKGDNSVKKYSDASLELCSRESVHSKISTFSSRQSIHTLLEIIYSCIFAMDFDKNYQNIIEINKEVEVKRFSNNQDINF